MITSANIKSCTIGYLKNIHRCVTRTGRIFYIANDPASMALIIYDDKERIVGRMPFLSAVRHRISPDTLLEQACHKYERVEEIEKEMIKALKAREECK